MFSDVSVYIGDTPLDSPVPVQVVIHDPQEQEYDCLPHRVRGCAQTYADLRGGGSGNPA
jgi:hypothetical protein